jgi:hypothetical protein
MSGHGRLGGVREVRDDFLSAETSKLLGKAKADGALDPTDRLCELAGGKEAVG